MEDGALLSGWLESWLSERFRAKAWWICLVCESARFGTVGALSEEVEELDFRLLMELLDEEDIGLGLGDWK